MKIEINLTDAQVAKFFGDNTVHTEKECNDHRFFGNKVRTAKGGAARPSEDIVMKVYYGLRKAREQLINGRRRQVLDIVDGLIDDIDNVLAES